MTRPRPLARRGVCDRRTTVRAGDADDQPRTCKDGDIMMSPKRQKTVVTIFVVVLGLAMVLGMIGRGVG